MPVAVGGLKLNMDRCQGIQADCRLLLMKMAVEIQQGLASRGAPFVCDILSLWIMVRIHIRITTIMVHRVS